MNKNNKEFDLVVIGAGPGGYTAAFRASDIGEKVLMIDKDSNLGGVCLNRGCIPSKSLLHITKVINDAESASKMGISFSDININLKRLKSWKNSIIKKFNIGLKTMNDNRNVSFINGNAKFISDSIIEVDSDGIKSEITFRNAIIATGSRSITLPSTPKSKLIWNSKDALELNSIPKDLLVIGGGYIGLELGSVYASLGSNITIAEMLDDILPGADKDLILPLSKKLSKNFSDILTGTRVENVKDLGEKISVNLVNESGSHEKEYDAILVSIGRKPNTDNIGLENTSITVDNKGFIHTDKTMMTSTSGIYAIGDVTHGPMLAHKASYEAKVAAEVISGINSANDARAIPCVIFTDPEIAWVGLTELDAKKNNIPYKKGEFPWTASGRATASGHPEGKTKIIFDPKTKKIIGGGIVGSNAGEMISELALAIEMGADAEDISLTIHPHPTLSETISNSAEVFEGTVTDIYIPK